MNGCAQFVVYICHHFIPCYARSREWSSLHVVKCILYKFIRQQSSSDDLPYRDVSLKASDPRCSVDSTDSCSLFSRWSSLARTSMSTSFPDANISLFISFMRARQICKLISQLRDTTVGYWEYVTPLLRPFLSFPLQLLFHSITIVRSFDLDSTLSFDQSSERTGIPSYA